MRFGAFDILQDTAQPPATDYSDRLDRLTELLPESENLFPIPCETCESTGELQEVFERYTSQGQSEGLPIARVSNGLTHKIKPEIELDAVVLAYTAKAGATSVRSLLLGLVGDDERFYLIGGVGASRHSDSEALFKTYRLQKLNQQLEELASAEAYRFVEPKVVVKITCTDIQSEVADGSDIEHWY